MAEETKTKEESLEIMNFRLTNIEKSIEELKDVVLDTKLQERDIKDLAATQNELLKAVNAHDVRIKNLELKPTKEKADRWQFIVEYIFKTVVAGIIIYFLKQFNFPV